MLWCCCGQQVSQPPDPDPANGIWNYPPIIYPLQHDLDTDTCRIDSPNIGGERIIGHYTRSGSNLAQGLAVLHAWRLQNAYTPTLRYWMWMRFARDNFNVEPFILTETNPGDNYPIEVSMIASSVPAFGANPCPVHLGPIEAIAADYDDLTSLNLDGNHDFGTVWIVELTAMFAANPDALFFLIYPDMTTWTPDKFFWLEGFNGIKLATTPA